MATFSIKQFDRRPLFVAVLKDDFGEPTEAIVDLTTATAAVFNMRESVSGTVKITRGSATISNPVGGEVTYAWGTADTNTAGEFQAEIEITWGDGKPETFPNNDYWTISIVDDIA